LGVSERNGIAFQNLVAALERALLKEDNAVLESPKRLPDKDTGRLREHDIVIRWKQEHHEIVTAIECRDTARPVGVPAVEAFAKKCEKTGIHHPVIVSAIGFTVTARAKALALNVSCMELAQAEDFPWIGMHFFIEDNRQFGPMDISAMCEDSMPEGDFAIFDVNETLVSNEALVATIANAVPYPESREEWIGKWAPLKLQVRAPGWKAVGSSGDQHKISHFNVATDVTITRSYKPVALHTYAGPAGPIDVATSEVDVGGFKGKIMMIKGSDEIKVVYVAEPSTRT
jgi:hypothetical protein